MAEAKIVLKAENNIKRGVSSATSDLNNFAKDVSNISKKISAAFNFSAVALAIKGITSLTKTATSALKGLADTTSKVTKEVIKYSASWAQGYEEMRLTYERLKLSIGDNREFENIVNTIDTLARSTTIAKDEIEAMASELAMLGKSATEIDKISKASVYLSTVTGRDLNSSMTTLLNTYNGVTTQLDKLGLNMKKFSKEELANGAAVDEVIKKYQDLNDEIASNSLLQSIQNIKEAGNTLKDGIGAFVTDAIGPTLQKISEAITDIEDAFSSIDGRVDFNGLLKLIKTFVSSLFTQLDTALNSPETYNKIINFISKLMKAVVPIITAGITMAINASKAAINGAGLANAQNNLVADQNKYNNYVDELLKKYNVSSLNGVTLSDGEQKNLDNLKSNITAGLEEVDRCTNDVIRNINKAIEPAIQYIGTELPNAFTSCVDAAKELTTIVPGMWSNAIGEAENYLNNYRADQVKFGGSKGGTWYGETLARASTIQQDWNKLADILNKNVVPRISEPLFGFAEAQETMGEAWNRFISEEGAANKNLFKLTYSQYLELIKQNEGLRDLAETTETMSFVEKGSTTSWYDELKKNLFGYTQQTAVSDGKGGFTMTPEFVQGIFGGLGQEEADFLGGTLDGLVESLGIFGDMILGVNPLLAVLKPVIEGFVSVMGPMVEAVIAPLQNALTKIGQLLAGIFAPLLDALAPVFTTIANILMKAIQPVLMLLQAPLSLIASVLVILEPILELVTKAFEFLMIPVRALAATLQWLAAWIKFIFLSLYNAIAWIWGGTQENNVPSSWSEYYAQSGQSASIDTIELGEGVASAVVEGLSTSTAVQNASYTGGGSLTQNIYIQAPLVGSDGMEEFARMLRQEMADLGYYGVAS